MITPQVNCTSGKNDQN
uniref:Uncharacterized protein n=1 Tax=Arundo donax TaxID=35708 RepID=A0A0A9AP37_ARUDO